MNHPTFWTEQYGRAGFIHATIGPAGHESYRAQSHGLDIIGEYKTLAAAKRALTIAHNHWLDQLKNGEI